MSTKTLPPDTRTTLNGYKLPLTEIPEGHGYYGTIAYDKSLRFTQCFICGFFYRNVSGHVVRTHNKKPRDYKIQYGLANRTSLLAPVTKSIYSKSIPQKQRAKNLMQARIRQTMSDKISAGKHPISLIERNKRGTCPDQLVDKIKVLKKKLRHMPSRSEFIKEYGWGPVKSIRLVYGSWGEAISRAGEMK